MGWAQNRLPKVLSFTKRWTWGGLRGSQRVKLQNASLLVTCSEPNIGFQFHDGGKEKGTGGVEG